MKKPSILLGTALLLGAWPADAAEIAQIKAVSMLPGATPPFRADITITGAAVVDRDDWRVNVAGTFQADVFISGAGAGATRQVDFGIRPSSRSMNLEARVVDLSTGGAPVPMGSCAYSLSGNSDPFAAAGGTRTISVTARKTIASPPVDCAWTVEKNVSWISILEGSAGGVGGGTVRYQVHPNTCGAERSGQIVMAGLSFTVTQDADDPAIAIFPPSRSHDDTASVGHRISVLDPCDIGWTAEETSEIWVHITSDTSGTGNGTVIYRIDANDSIVARQTTITINQESFTVVQDGVDCAYSISQGDCPSVFPAEGTSTSCCLQVSATEGCVWAASASRDWVSIVSPAAGIGPGEICVTVAENLTTNDRHCVISAGSARYTLTQAAGDCQYSLPGSEYFEFPNSGGIGYATVSAPSGCVWTVDDSEVTDWVQITSRGFGEGSGDFAFSVLENTNVEARTGFMYVKDQVITVAQSSGCTTPCGTEYVTNRQPVFLWCPVDDATWHQIVINHNGKAFYSKWLEQTTTAWTPESDLPCGSFEWWSRSYIPGVGAGPWSPSCTFTIECCTPGAVIGAVPDAVCLEPGDVTYAWDVDLCTSWYQLWVGLNGGTFHSKWYETGIQPSGTVSQVVSNHPFGEFQWWVRGWGPDGMGNWARAGAFAIGATEAQGPLGSTTSPVFFSWDDTCTGQAEWFHLWVNREGNTFLNKWYRFDETGLCDTTERCLSDSISLPFGEYTWWIQAWAAGGTGPWSEAAEFDVGAATPIDPTGDVASPLTFSWDEEFSADATWYHFQASDGNTTIWNEWMPRDDTFDDGPGVRRLDPMPWRQGQYTWWMRAWAPGGTGPWSDGTSFTVP